MRARLLLILISSSATLGPAGCLYDYGALSGNGDRGSTGGVRGAQGGATTGRSGSGGVGDHGGGMGAVGTGGKTSGGAGSGGAGVGDGSSGGASGASGGSGGTDPTSSGGTVGTGGAGDFGTAGAGGGDGDAGSGGGGASGAGGAGIGGAGSGATSGGGAGAGGNGSGAGGDAAPSDVDLVLWYRFDDASGQTAADSSGFAGGPRNATLNTGGTAGGITLAAAKHQVGTGAVGLTANGTNGGGYVAVPSLYDLVPDAVTIAGWVNPTSASANQRLFDFGDNITTFMFLTTADTGGYIRFVITNTGIATEQRIQTSTTLSLNTWHHVALVLAAGNPKAGAIYVDGTLAATAMLTIGVHELGLTTNNYLGRSQFPGDPYFAGSFDDFRVYKRALTKAEITTILGLR